MPINSNKKGKVGERELAKILRDYGFTARRGQQFSGGGDSPDVVHDIPGIHIEVKRTEKLDMWKALDQAVKDKKPTDAATVFHRPNKKPWIVVMHADDFLGIVRAMMILSQSEEARTVAADAA